MIIGNKDKHLELELLFADPYWPKIFSTEKKSGKRNKKMPQKEAECLVPVLPSSLARYIDLEQVTYPSGPLFSYLYYGRVARN